MRNICKMQHAKVGLRRVRIDRLAYRTGRRHVDIPADPRTRRQTQEPLCTSCGSYPLRKSSMHFGGTWQAALSWHGVPARSRFNDTRRACTNKLWSMSVEIWEAAGPNPCLGPDAGAAAGTIPSKISQCSRGFQDSDAKHSARCNCWTTPSWQTCYI